LRQAYDYWQLKTEDALGIEDHVDVAIVDEKCVVDIVLEGCVEDNLVANVDNFEMHVVEGVVGYEDVMRKVDCYNCTDLVANVVVAEEDRLGEEEVE